MFQPLLCVIYQPEICAYITSTAETTNNKELVTTKLWVKSIRTNEYHMLWTLAKCERKYDIHGYAEYVIFVLANVSRDGLVFKIW